MTRAAVVDVGVFTFFSCFIVVAFFFFISVLLSMLVTTIISDVISLSVSVKSFISRVVDLFTPTEMLLQKKAFLEEQQCLEKAFIEEQLRSDHQLTHDTSVTFF